jgi:hypothetical protein
MPVNPSPLLPKMIIQDRPFRQPSSELAASHPATRPSHQNDHDQQGRQQQAAIPLPTGSLCSFGGLISVSVGHSRLRVCLKKNLLLHRATVQVLCDACLSFFK